MTREAALQTLLLPARGLLPVRTNLTILISGAVLMLALGAPEVSQAEPKVCTGFLPDTKRWGNQLQHDKLFCPPHFAFFGTAKPVGENGEATAIVAGTCCPLPETDILVDSHSFASGHCPEDTVATGIRVNEGSTVTADTTPQNRRFELRCTKINTDRYQLGQSLPGALWGFDLASGPYFWKEDFTLKTADLPPAIRAGLERHDYQEFSRNGCVGMPFGSLLVAKTGKRCKSLFFRQLQYRGIAADPAQATPVAMYPDCRYISDPFSPDPECVK